MTRCFELAAHGMRHCAPNPMVGAVLVYQDRILGEGYHAVYGGDHAEVACIKNVNEKDKPFIKDSTLFVSLEPCNHFGKTPPCSHFIVDQGIKKIVIGSLDPNPMVNGTGIDYLTSNGVEVHIEDFQLKQEQLNKRFFTNQNKKRPYIILKWAQSADGFLSREGERLRISNRLTDALVHKWRSEEGAIWIGANTLLTDNPKLTVRKFFGSNPLRILYDKSNTLLKNEFFFNADDNYLAFHSDSKIKDEYYVQEDRCLEEILNKLYAKNIGSLLVEGGAQLLNSFLQHHLYDEIRVITNSELFLEDGVKAPLLSPNIKFSDELFLDTDQITLYHNFFS